jgi:hypothetical protein
MERRKILEVIFGDEKVQRFTQDSPILPEVWVKYFEEGVKPLDLLLNPHRESNAGVLCRELRIRLENDRTTRNFIPHQLRSGDETVTLKSVVYNESHVVGEMYLDELVRIALPLTKWWWEYVWRKNEEWFRPDRLDSDLIPNIESAMKNPLQQEFSEDFLWLVRTLGTYAVEHLPTNGTTGVIDLIGAGMMMMTGMPTKKKEECLLWSVSLNRPAKGAIWQSVPSVKADAARRLFEIKCKDLCWAVVDSGVDARHPAFVDRKQLPPLELPLDAPERSSYSRVVRTYDFTRIRELLEPEEEAEDVLEGVTDYTPEVRARMKEAKRRGAELKDRLRAGQGLDWGALERQLRIEHDATYFPPATGHGTHVGGIVAADWRLTDGNMPPGENSDLGGMCRDIRLYDLRVLNEKGEGNEFTVMAALQFVRYLNAGKDMPVVHGVNLSLSIPHDVTTYACGCTPVCEECERLIGNGVVVVAAAGNKGYVVGLAAALGVAQYQDISVTDPGNAEAVITVGATHRVMPHTYGVSYFSSRGPTGDGRSKPDLVAPGEKIKSVVPGGLTQSMDGTSMAAPHVSGAAALLMARHTEFIGQPARVKKILCSTATDLGRERYFQGAGLLDILRAIQSV